MGPVKGQFTQNSNHVCHLLTALIFFFFHFLSWFEFLCFVHISCKVVRLKLPFGCAKYPKRHIYPTCFWKTFLMDYIILLILCVLLKKKTTSKSDHLSDGRVKN